MTSKAARRRHEDKLNLKLHEILVNAGLKAEWQSEHAGNTRIDIEVVTEQIRIAVECEKYGSSKQVEALKDAASRLVPIARVDIAVAVVYPEGCDSDDDLTCDTVLTYTVVRKENAVKYGRDHKKHAQSIRWMVNPASRLPNVLRHLYRDVGNPDTLASNLKTRLDVAVSGMSESQCRSLAKSIKLEYSALAKRHQLNAAAKRSLLVVASAALFHARLGDYLESMKPASYSGEWNPQTLGRCRRDDVVGTKGALLKTWEHVLRVDYKPIFESAVNVLVGSSGQWFANAIDSMAEWAQDAADQTVSLRHDLLGRIFHTVLDTAKQDGSFYTTTSAAVLLAGLAIRDRSDIPNDLNDMKIVDPACGTGTLLMAAAERIRDVMEDEYDPNTIVENVLCGVDINVTAAHMAATTIGMLSPDTKFDRMDIRIADLGMVDGEARAGSLEMYVEDGLLPYVDWHGGTGKQVDTGDTTKHTWKDIFDLVIMNPPFTRNSLRHDQLGKKIENLVKQRESEIFKTIPRGQRHSSGPMFIRLAEHLSRKTLAVVLPSVVTSSPGNLLLRQFLASKFHVDTIVVPHDPKRFHFSASTDIAEVLVILRKEPPCDTCIVNLRITPGSVAEAATLADTINEEEEKPASSRRLGSDINSYQIVRWPRSRVEKGDWSGVQFYSPYLVDRFVDIVDGKLFKTVRLGDVADTGEPPQGVRMTFDASDTPDRYARFVRHDHKTKEVRSMHAVPNKYLIPKPGKEKQAESAWAKGGLLHIGERLRFNLVHAVAVKTNSISIGTSWHAISPKAKTGDQELWSRAMAVWLNSTVGIVSLLGKRSTSKDLAYVRFPIDSLCDVLIPELDKRMMLMLTRAYDKYSDSDLGLIRDPNATRIALDKAVCRVLGLDESVMSTMRTELSREPMITGKRYGEQPSLDDYS